MPSTVTGLADSAMYKTNPCSYRLMRQCCKTLTRKYNIYEKSGVNKCS